MDAAAKMKSALDRVFGLLPIADQRSLVAPVTIHIDTPGLECAVNVRLLHSMFPHKFTYAISFIDEHTPESLADWVFAELIDEIQRRI